MQSVYISFTPWPQNVPRFCVLRAIAYLSRIIATLECTERCIDSIEPVIERCTCTVTHAKSQRLSQAARMSLDAYAPSGMSPVCNNVSGWGFVSAKAYSKSRSLSPLKSKLWFCVCAVPPSMEMRLGRVPIWLGEKLLARC